MQKHLAQDHLVSTILISFLSALQLTRIPARLFREDDFHRLSQ